MDKKLEHIGNVIKPWDVNQFIRTFYLNATESKMVSDEELEKYLGRVRERVYENGYAEEDYQKVIADAKAIANGLDGLDINLN